ncbi:MAG: PorT family protein [Saprospiraceae bacterium]|nr:PorT family protein [Saprospiraceae bacterium]MCB0544675.1 PorT family protein [Saprospiraceae bacterium]
MRINTFTTILLFAAALTPALLAAQPRFRAGLIAGLTASQIDGDLSAGYNKLGFQAGLRTTARLTPKTEGSIEFLFVQRGSQSELVRDQFNPYNFSLTLNYVEVPLQWHYKDWLVEGDGNDEDYYRVSLNLGLSYARFMNASVDDELSGVNVVVPDYLKKNDFSFLIGASFFATRHIGLTVRYVRSIGYMYDPRDWDPAPAQKAWNAHSLYFQTMYMF